MLDEFVLVLVAYRSFNHHAFFLLVERHSPLRLSSDVLVVVEGELMEGLRRCEIEQSIAVRQLIRILMRVFRLIVKNLLLGNEPHVLVHLPSLSCEYS